MVYMVYYGHLPRSGAHFVGQKLFAKIIIPRKWGKVRSTYSEAHQGYRDKQWTQDSVDLSIHHQALLCQSWSAKEGKFNNFHWSSINHFLGFRISTTSKSHRSMTTEDLLGTNLYRDLSMAQVTHISLSTSSYTAYFNILYPHLF